MKIKTEVLPADKAESIAKAAELLRMLKLHIGELKTM